MESTNPFSISPDEIAALTTESLVALLNRLIENQGAYCGLTVDSVRTTLRINDPDGGVDAYVDTGQLSDQFLGTGSSVWQFKKTYPTETSRTGARSELELELYKPSVQTKFGEGAGYTLVVAKQIAVGGPYGQIAKLNRLETLARSAGCIGEVRLLVANHIASWATRDPAALLSIRPAVRGLRSIQSELDSQRHTTTFEPDPQQAVILAEIGDRLLSSAPSVCHVRIQGKAGVGKSRLALEAGHKFGPAESVFFTTDTVTQELFDWVISEPQARITLIADECETSDAVRYAAKAEQAEGRIRLITVGPGITSGPNVFVLDPIGEETIESIVQSETGLTRERARWIARKTKGFVKLAVLIAKAIVSGTTNIADLNSDSEIARLVESLLATSNHERDALRGVSLLTRVGVDGSVMPEGQAIAEFLGVEWNRFRNALGAAQSQGIVVKRGRFLYVSPELLAVWLAGEVWKVQAERIVDLQQALPSQAARQSFMTRLASLADIPEVERVVAESLLGPAGPFRRVSDISDEVTSRLYSTIAKGHLGAGLVSLERMIGGATDEELLQFTTGRQEAIWTLRRLLERRDSFLQAARLLRRLAENETETRFSNNATDYWNKAFLVFLGQTEMPPLERLPVIDEALASTGNRARMLGISALSAMMDLSEHAGIEMSDELLPPEHWQPRTWAEVRDIRLEALNRLVPLFNDRDCGVSESARKALRKQVRGLIQVGLADQAISALQILTKAAESEDEKQNTWQTLMTLLNFESSALNSAQKEEIAQLARIYYGDSLTDRIKRYTGPNSYSNWDSDDIRGHRQDEVISQLADEANTSEEWSELLPWLVSGDAHMVHVFAQRLGEVDQTRKWLNELLETSRVAVDLRLLTIYLTGWATLSDQDEEKVHRLLDGWATEPAFAAIVADAALLMKPSTRSARRLLGLINQDLVKPAYLGWLRSGIWMEVLPAEVITEILNVLLEDGSPDANTAGQMLLATIEERSSDLYLREYVPFTWRFLEEPAGWSDSNWNEYFWNKLAEGLVGIDTPRMIRLLSNVFSTVQPTYEDKRMALLVQAAAAYPVEALEAITPILLSSPDNFRFRWELRTAGFFDNVDASSVEEWLSKYGAAGVEAIADSINVKTGELLPVVRFLLNNHFELVRSTLKSRAWEGSWIGSEVTYLEPRIDSARNWALDSDVNVRRWAGELRDWLESLAIDARRQEEEEIWRW